MCRPQEAVELFHTGYACAQAVVIPYHEELGLTREQATKMSSGFAAGMRMGETCGAVTGACMVLGLKYCPDQGNTPEKRMKVYSKINEFTRRFKEWNTHVRCEDLLGVDIASPEGQQKACEMCLFQSKCPQYVKDAAAILDVLITEPPAQPA